MVPDCDVENVILIYSEPDSDPYDSAVESGVDDDECSECRRTCLNTNISTCQTEVVVAYRYFELHKLLLLNELDTTVLIQN